MQHHFVLLMACAVALTGCDKKPVQADAASVTTIAANQAVAQSLPLAERQDFDDAARGLIARPTGQLLEADNTVLIDFDAYQFVKGPAPTTVNPSLWRHAQLNTGAGLYKVSERVYQLRGFDIGNITLIVGNSGWIVVDALTARETAAAAMAFARQHLGQQPISALIFTHSHADHFGGALGVLSPAEIQQRKLPVIAPVGFLQEATSENVLVGTAMGRRSEYQFGRNLPHSVTGSVDNGLGKDLAYGAIGILEPNLLITQPAQEVEVDGLRFIFHNVPGAEAPAELTFTVPQLKLYAGAEILSQTMHNLLPVRGAKVRDALLWSNYLDSALLQAADADVYVGQHNWPVWGNARIVELITKHRDVYRYTHDQTVRLINAGMTPDEIAEQVKLPPSLASYFGARGYYGDLRHNVRAVYQHYIGHYDGNPAHLDTLPPQDSAARYVALIGGADRVLAAAQAAFDKGEYRWTAELLNQLVMCAPTNKKALNLLARTYEQLGYQSEAATWRNSYLKAAQELRQGPPKVGLSRAKLLDMLAHTPTERFLESVAASLNGPAAIGKNLTINLIFTDTHESFVLWIENAVLHYKKSAPAAKADATLSLTKSIFLKVITGTAGIKETLLSDDVKVSGSTLALLRFFGLLDKAPGTFAIVTPEKRG